MDEKMQIEEMARDIFEPKVAIDGIDIVFAAVHGADRDSETQFMRIARHLYSKGYRKIPDNIGDFSDGYHTFNELYHHRAVLFSVICNMFPENAWKSKLHDTGDMYEGMFIVGIETEQGQATYHYDVVPYWDMFKVKELEKAPKWDGHSPSDAIERIGNLLRECFRVRKEAEWIAYREKKPFGKVYYICSRCGRIEYTKEPYCNCGAKMKGE